MVYGHENKTEFFKNLVNEGTLGHAYLFFGEPQIGKHHFVRHLAYYLEYEKFDILENPLVDAVFISPDENKKKIGIGKLREMRDFLHQKPFRSDKRLVVIDEADLLTPQAQASLLKFVEDAPDHITVVFIARNPQSFLPPLASRLQSIYFSRLKDEELISAITEEFDLSEEKAQNIVRRSFGRFGRALDIIKGKEYNRENLEEFVEESIVNLFLDDKIGSSKKLKWLIERETKIKRFTINPKLQRKVIESKINGRIKTWVL